MSAWVSVVSIAIRQHLAPYNPTGKWYLSSHDARQYQKSDDTDEYEARHNPYGKADHRALVDRFLLGRRRWRWRRGRRRSRRRGWMCDDLFVRRHTRQWELCTRGYERTLHAPFCFSCQVDFCFSFILGCGNSNVPEKKRHTHTHTCRSRFFPRGCARFLHHKAKTRLRRSPCTTMRWHLML